jgi:hypothetical protein
MKTKRVPRFVWKVLFALPFGYAVFMQDGLLAALVIMGFVIAGISVGHGNVMDNGTNPERKQEWFEVYRDWLRKKGVSERSQDFIGLSLTGLFVTLPVGIVLGNVFIALSGVLKALSYRVGYLYGGKTESGELLTGALLTCAIAGCVLGF